MPKLTKRQKQIAEIVDVEKEYNLAEAVDTLKKLPKLKFDETVELVFSLNIDPKKADQMLRGITTLPNGTGKKVTIMVFANEAQEKEALEAGADFAGFREYFDKVKNGWVDFDVLISTPDLMREVGKLGKVLGPKGLMPSPKAGTVTADVKTAVNEIKKGKIEYRTDKHGNVALGIGKLSFDAAKIAENAKIVIEAVIKAKPASVKGDYVKKISLASTMGPGLSLNYRELI